MATRVVVVGIGGASCSGKTLLAKHLARVLPNAVIMHQDDFAPNSDNVPVHPEHGVQDWDDPTTCIEWPRMRAALEHVRRLGTLPGEHESFDHLNKQVAVGVNSDLASMWRERLAMSKDITWILVDGFVLYWDRQVADALDVKLMLRVPREKLQARREARSTYVLQNAEDAATGGVWEDPPEYFQNIVYPAYVKAHKDVFANGDVEKGDVKPESGITLIDPPEGDVGMTLAFEQACTALLEAIEDGRGVSLRG